MGVNMCRGVEGCGGPLPEGCDLCPACGSYNAVIVDGEAWEVLGGATGGKWVFFYSHEPSLSELAKVAEKVFQGIRPEQLKVWTLYNKIYFGTQQP